MRIIARASAVKVLGGVLAKGGKPVDLRDGQTIDTLFNRVIGQQML